MNRRSWVWALLLALVISSTSTTALRAQSSHETACDGLNTELYGADGRHGLALTYRLLKDQIAYVDQLLAHSRTKEAADLRTFQQAQSAHPGARIRDIDLQIDRDLLSRFGSVRAQLQAELENVVRSIAVLRGELQRRGCQERVDPNSGQFHVEDTTPVVRGESPLCADVRTRLLSLREGIAAVKRVVAFSTLVHNVLDEEQGAAVAAMGQPNSDIAAELRVHDAALEQQRISERRDEAEQEGTVAETLRLARLCPELQTLPNLSPPRPAPRQTQIITQAMPRSIAGTWHMREVPSLTAQAYDARINDVDANGEYWGVIYKNPQWPIHFHGRFQGASMPFAWYDNVSSGQGTLTYQDADHVMASWRDTGKHPGQSGNWYLSR